MARLRIYIPTFNRWDRLQVQLDLLQDALCLGASFDLRIFDNASTDALTSAFPAGGYPAHWQLHSFPENVGFEGNVQRILADAGEGAPDDAWLWILSDDDFILPASVAQLTMWLSGQPETLPVLLSFLMFEGGAVRRRPPVAYGSPDLSRAEVFKLINQTTLISCWLYPAQHLRAAALDRLGPWRRNSFLQMILLAVVLEQAGSIAQFERPVGFEFVNLRIRFRLRDTFAVDRPAALRAAAEVLGLATTDIDPAMRAVADGFARRALVWECAGDLESSAQALAAMPEFRARGWLTRRARGWLLIRRLVALLKRGGLAGPLSSKGAASQQRAQQTQDLLTAAFRSGTVRLGRLPGTKSAPPVVP